MTNLIASDQKRLIIGMGQTGLSCARFLVAKGMSFDLCDTRELLPNQAEIEAEFPQCQFFNGKLDADVTSNCCGDQTRQSCSRRCGYLCRICH